MKKILILLTFSLSLFALDLSENTNSDQNYKEDTIVGYSKGLNVNNSKDSSKDSSKTKEYSYSVSTDLSKIEQTSALIMLMSLEIANIEPFASCRVLVKPSLPADFELTCDNGDSRTNSGRCSFLNEAATSNFNLEEVTYMTDEIKSYMSCVALYGALIAQDMKYGKFSPNLYDKELVSTFKLFDMLLSTTDCRLNGSSSSIMCGSSIFNISPEPKLVFTNISLYSDNAYYGYNSSVNISRSKRRSKSQSLTQSKKKSKAVSMAKTINDNKSASVSLSKSSAANLSLSKFLPAD